MNQSAEELAAKLSLEELGQLKQAIELRLREFETPPKLFLTHSKCHILSETYSLDKLINQGTYGFVWRGTDLLTKQTFALKQIKLKPHSANTGFPIQFLREIDALRNLHTHGNIVQLHEVVIHQNDTSPHHPFDFFLVLEHFPTDVKSVLLAREFSSNEVKHIMRQVLSALEFIHSKQFMHRDLKWENVLLDEHTGRIALADFGMCRREHAGRRYSYVVVTLHYRPPELLMLQDTYVGSSADMWSMGCLFYELVTGRVLFPGTTELEELNLIWDILGTPSNNVADGDLRYWPQFQFILNKLGLNLAEQNVRKLPSIFSNGGDALLEQMLALNPENRISASNALRHEWFV